MHQAQLADRRSWAGSALPGQRPMTDSTTSSALAHAISRSAARVLGGGDLTQSQQPEHNAGDEHGGTDHEDEHGATAAPTEDFLSAGTRSRTPPLGESAEDGLIQAVEGVEEAHVAIMPRMVSPRTCRRRDCGTPGRSRRAPFPVQTKNGMNRSLPLGPMCKLPDRFGTSLSGASAVTAARRTTDRDREQRSSEEHQDENLRCAGSMRPRQRRSSNQRSGR